MTYADDGYIRHKAQAAMLSALKNLVPGTRYALGARAEMRFGTAIVVGAGPSLDVNGHLLTEMQAGGALIITTNTAAAAVERRVVPDVVLSREVVNVASHLVPARCHVIDLAATPFVWQAAESICLDVRGFVAGGLQFFELAAQLDVRPLFGGPAALTAAVELAREWGAARIALLGVDLAFADDGQGYATNSAFDGYRGMFDGNRVALGGEGFERMRLQSLAGGLDETSVPREQSVATVAAIGGGTRQALYTWLDQLVWLETFASRYGQDIQLFDLTAEGAEKRGWMHAPTVPITRMELPHTPTLETKNIDRAIADVRRQCDTVESVAASVIDLEGAPVGVPGFLDGCDIIEAAAAGALLDLRSQGGSVRDGVRSTCDALTKAASIVRDVL